IVYSETLSEIFISFFLKIIMITVNQNKVGKNLARGGDFIVDVSYVDDSRQHIEIQEYIMGEKFSTKHLNNLNICNQFIKIKRNLQRMRKDGINQIDLIGIDGAFGNYFGNIIVDQEQKLKIIDATLLESKSLGFVGYLFSPIMTMGKILQKRILDKYTKETYKYIA
ncbi:MAG: hypothetical protein O3B87_04895, partial [bacterium]|nr:hypothetical protein [bacterium]